MKFRLTTFGRWYTADQVVVLEGLGFSFEPLKEEDLESALRRIEDRIVSIQIETLEDILQLAMKTGPMIVYDGVTKGLSKIQPTGEPTIAIFDVRGGDL